VLFVFGVSMEQLRTGNRDDIREDVFNCVKNVEVEIPDPRNSLQLQSSRLLRIPVGVIS